MLLNVNRVKGFGIQAENGGFGRAEEFLFDDREGVIRYLVADTNRWLPGKKVLLSPAVLRKPDCARKTIPVSLSREQVGNCPTAGEHLPTDREREYKINQANGWKIYWADGPNVLLPADVEPDLEAREGDSHLQSTESLIGYQITATDGTAGRLEDFVLDDDFWTIRYFVADTGSFLSPMKVLVDAASIQEINQREKKIFVNLTREKVKTCPEYVRMALVS